MAQTTTTVAVGTVSPALLWQTSTGVSPDPKTTAAGNATAQIFRAGTFNDPVQVTIQNTDATNPVYLGGSTVAASGATLGEKLLAGITKQLPAVIGNDSMYAISTGGTVNVVVRISPGN
jgi:hypothetical protein